MSVTTNSTSSSATSAATSAGASAPATGGKNVLGKDDFLKIFLAQLSQQDPTSPVDSQAFVAQLAQFSSLELQQNANTDLEALMLGQAAAQQTSATNLVGKDVAYRTDSVTLSSGQPVTVNAQLQAPAANVTVVITDAGGQAVRTLHLGPQNAGPVAVSWDGHNDAGAALPAGDYHVSVTAADPTGAAVGVQQTATGHISGVSFSNGKTQLLVGTDTINLSDVTQITERTAP